MRASRAQLLVGEEDGAEKKRHEVVDRAVGEQGAEEGLGGNAAQHEQHDRLEDADASRHVADDSGDDRDGVGADEGDEADVRAGQQPPEHRAREAHVDHAEHHLGQSDRGAGARSAQPRISSTPRDVADHSA